MGCVKHVLHGNLIVVLVHQPLHVFNVISDSLLKTGLVEAVMLVSILPNHKHVTYVTQIFVPIVS